MYENFSAIPVRANVKKLSSITRCRPRWNELKRWWSFAPASSCCRVRHKAGVRHRRHSQAAVWARANVRVPTRSAVMAQNDQKRNGHLARSWCVACVRYPVNRSRAPVWHCEHVARMLRRLRVDAGSSGGRMLCVP